MGKVDPNEAPPGCVAVEDGDDFYPCEPCCMRDKESGVCWSIGSPFSCGAAFRKDGCNCHFISNNGRATASFPYDDMGTPVEVVS